MRSTAFLTGLLACMTSSVIALPSDKIGTITWTGQVQKHEATPMTLKGTPEDIYAQILALNPLYDEQFGPESNNKAPKFQSSPSLQSRSLETRSTTSDDWACTFGTAVNAQSIGTGVKALYAIGNGDCTAPVGPGGCTFVECNDGAGIKLCNDKASGTMTTSCSVVADNAVEVLINCHSTTYANGVWTGSTHGQIFSNDRSWNVILDAC